MKLLLDECVPRRIKSDFINFEVSTIDEAGFKGLKNGNLIRAASGVFEVLITVDKNLNISRIKQICRLQLSFYRQKATATNHSRR